MNIGQPEEAGNDNVFPFEALFKQPDQLTFRESVGQA